MQTSTQAPKTTKIQELFDSTPWWEAGCPATIDGIAPPEEIKSLTDWHRWAEKTSKERGVPIPE